MKVIGFNGPPRSYKSTRAQEFAAYAATNHGVEVRIHSYMEPFDFITRRLAEHYTGLTLTNYEKFKSMTLDERVTGRDLIIAVVKGVKSVLPDFVSEVMRQKIAKAQQDGIEYFVIENIGYENEINYIVLETDCDFHLVYMTEKRPEYAGFEYRYRQQFHADSRICLNDGECLIDASAQEIWDHLNP